MERQDKYTHIRRLPIFSELGDDEVMLFEPFFRVVDYKAGEYVYRQAENSYALYLFVSGRGRLLRVGADGIERRGDDVEPGEFVGERSLFLHEERPHSLVIVRDAKVLVLPRRDFDDFIRSNPRIKARLNIRDDVRHKIGDQDFPWLNRGEIVLRYTRRHRWSFIRRALWAIPLFFIFLPLPVIVIAMPFLPRFLVVVAAFPMLFFPVLAVVYNYFDWRNDWFVLTNNRLVHEERVLLTFNETRQQAPLKSIQTVRTRQDGYWAERLGFGDLIIGTAGAGGTLVFDTIEEPEEFSRIINQEISRTGAHRAAESRDKIREEIDRFLGTRALNRTRADELPQPAGTVRRQPTPPQAVRTRLQERWESIARYFDIRVRIDDGVRVTYRKHWLMLWNDIFAPTFTIILAIILLLINLIWSWAWPWNLINPVLRVLFFLLLFPFLGAWWWYMYEDWHNDLYVVEGQTLTCIHRRPLWLQDEQSTILIRNIQGVNVSIKGIWQKMLNYGTVIIQTAADDDPGEGGTTGEIMFHYVHQPHNLQEDILRRQRQEEVTEEKSDAEQFAEQIARWLAVYHQATHPEDFDTEAAMRDVLDKGAVQDKSAYQGDGEQPTIRGGPGGIPY